MPTFTSSVGQDLRYGLRTLTRTPGFTATAVVVLALGIGVNATVFSLANAFFFRALPVSDPGSVVRVYANRFSNVRYPLYEALRDRTSTLSGLAGFQLRSFGMTVDGDPEHVFGEIVSGNYFPILGITAAGGRLLGPADDAASAPLAVVLSHGFWTRRFGGAPDVVGRTVLLNGVPFTIVGIADARFTGVLAPTAGDLWAPIAADAHLRPMLDPSARRESISLHLVGRLKPGVHREQAQAELDTIGREIRAAAGDTTQRQAVTVYASTMLHPETSTPVTMFTAVLMTVVGLVLVIVCVNIANLVLARAAGRDVEMAVRQSLGAGRTRLIRQLLTENLLLSIAGAAGGLTLAFWATRMLTAARLPIPIPVRLDLSLDLRVLGFTTVIAVLATLAFGMAPALAASRIDLVSALKGIGSERPRHNRLRSTFLVAQVAMSVLLLVTAGLFIRSFRAAQSMDTGFDATGVVAAAIDFETRGYRPPQALALLRSFVERLESRPAVVSANVVDIVPLTLSSTTTFMLRDGDAVPAQGQRPPTPQIFVNAVGPGHFKTLAIPLIAGRDFTYDDVAGGQQVAVVNETLARRFWPGKNAVGQRLRPLDREARGDTLVVGVVRDSKYVTVGEAERPFLYAPLAQAYTPRVTVLVRGTGPPASTASIVKQELRALDAALPLYNEGPLSEAISISLLPARMSGSLLAGLGVLALVLAAIGIYGVLSFLVRSRTREIGIRVAIGARPGTVAAMIVRQAILWTAAGASIGIGLALVLTRFLVSFLYGVSPTDPWTYGVVTVTLTLVAGFAALVPALRAARMDPLAALRHV